jgi:hypothetical protein
MLNLQYQYNNHTTTPYMKVDSTHSSPLSCEKLLCSCCDGIVYESNPNDPFTFLHCIKESYFKSDEIGTLRQRKFHWR